jgi:hypothetical protein
MEIYNERVSDLLSAEDKTIKIQEDMVCVMIHVNAPGQEFEFFWLC